MIDPFHRPGALAHQYTAFERFKDESIIALLFDPRCRKTATTLAIWRYRVERGDVDALVVLCADLGGVKWIWADEAPKELPPEFMNRTKMLVWQSGKTDASECSKREIFALRDHQGPVLLAMNASALARSENAWKYLEWFNARRRVMLVVDESRWAARWSGQTKKLLTLGGRRGRDTSNIVVRAILDGTPVDESPFDIYYPSEFLQPGLLGYSTLSAFKARYANWSEITWWNQKKNRPDTFPKLIGYRNLDELRENLFRFAMRVRREDISDAPPKQYESVFFEMSDRQRNFYDRLCDEYVADLERGEMPVREVLRRMTRLQMVARNYWPPERGRRDCEHCEGRGWLDGGEDCAHCEGLGAHVVWSELERIDPDCNPAMDALLERVATIGGPFVVWCRFKQDASDVLYALYVANYNAMPYWGDYSNAEKEANYIKFRDGDGTRDCIVATIAGGPSLGKNLGRAHALLYFSNDFKLQLRRQTEDRAEGVLKTFSTAIIDLIAVGTRDADVVEALRAKKDLAALVLGDPRPWLEGE